MSIVEDAKPSLDPNLIRWGGYGLTLVGAAVGLYALLRPDILLTGLAIILALAPLGMAASWPQLFEVNQRGGRRGLNPLVGAAAFVLLIASFSVSLVDDWAPWVAAFAVGGALTATTWAAAQRPGLASPLQALIVMALLGGLYGYGAYNLADVRFDPSAGTSYQAAVSGKYLSYGRHNSTYYHLSLPPWGPRPAPSSVQVPQSTYDAVQPGDPICLTLHTGALGGRWYRAALCSAP